MEGNKKEDEKKKWVVLTEEPDDDDDDIEFDQLTAKSKAAWIEDNTIGPDSFSHEMREMYWDAQPSGLIEPCPCHTTPKKTAWDEKQWKKHWKDRNQEHKKRIERLHKDSRQ